MWENFSSTIPTTICGLRWHKPSGISSPPSTITAGVACMGICGTRKAAGPYRGSEGRADPIGLSVEVLCR